MLPFLFTIHSIFILVDYISVNMVKGDKILFVDHPQTLTTIILQMVKEVLWAKLKIIVNLDESPSIEEVKLNIYSVVQSKIGDISVDLNFKVY